MHNNKIQLLVHVEFCDKMYVFNTGKTPMVFPDNGSNEWMSEYRSY